MQEEYIHSYCLSILIVNPLPHQSSLSFLNSCIIDLLRRPKQKSEYTWWSTKSNIVTKPARCPSNIALYIEHKVVKWCKDKGQTEYETVQTCILQVLIHQQSFLSFNAATEKANKISVLKFSYHQHLICEFMDALHRIFGQPLDSNLFPIVQLTLLIAIFRWVLQCSFF